MTKDIMRADIAQNITEVKEENIKFINKMDALIINMDQMIAVIQEIKYEALRSQAQIDALIINIDDMDTFQLACALTNTIAGVVSIQDKLNKSGDEFSKILEE
jgi:translation elongation factor EF-G